MIDHLVLIFAYHFPPENAVGAARPFRFSKYLSSLGYTCRVFTASEQTGCNAADVEYVPDPFVDDARHTFGWQLERAIRRTILPGEKGIQWSYLASRAARAFIRANPSSAITIFSTFPPLGTHLAAWQLARSEGLPWIADLRDPFPVGQGNQGPKSLRERTYRWLERRTAQRADTVIANTDGAMAEWQRKFPDLKGKFQLIWNGFDPEDRVGPLPASSGDRKVLSHVGELYGGRVPTPILESIARLIAAGRLSPRSVRVRLIGPAEPDVLPDRGFLDRARSEGWLELVTEQIPRREALQITQTSDGLLLLQPQRTTAVPGKLFEYLQIGRPILAFIQPNSSIERLIQQSGVPYRCVYPDNPPSVMDDTVADFFSFPSSPVPASPWFEEHFNSKNQTRQLDAIIRSLHTQHGRSVSPSVARSSCAESAAPTQNLKIGEQIAKPALDSIEQA
jgi:hypothetical protein